ncbi:hypothetical protein AHF37_12389 [Paragonimus kellicotti]|nr:hypothetical protein AHF37_12389 [Paragonimus kellicotti]
MILLNESAVTFRCASPSLDSLLPFTAIRVKMIS